VQITPRAAAVSIRSTVGATRFIVASTRRGPSGVQTISPARRVSIGLAPVGVEIAVPAGKQCDAQFFSGVSEYLSADVFSRRR
jgi:hypothetical protein